MKFKDEIEDLSDLGQCICALLTSSSYGVKNGLWEMFERVLSDDIFENLKEVVSHWEEEQEEVDEIEILETEKEPKSKKDDWF